MGTRWMSIISRRPPLRCPFRRQAKGLGTEIDGKISYRPYQNLSITGYAGYFIPGDFFEQQGALRAATIAAGGNPVEDDAWIIRAEAVVTF